MAKIIVTVDTTKRTIAMTTDGHAVRSPDEIRIGKTTTGDIEVKFTTPDAGAAYLATAGLHPTSNLEADISSYFDRYVRK